MPGLSVHAHRTSTAQRNSIVSHQRPTGSPRQPRPVEAVDGVARHARRSRRFADASSSAVESNASGEKRKERENQQSGVRLNGSEM
jgi:hypothetical protein